MKIIGRNPNPDRYSIKEIRIDYELHRRVREKADGTRTPLADVYLLVDLEPKPYMRQRFVDGHSYGPKKNPCTLRIELTELQNMQQVISSRLQETYQFLSEHSLLGEFSNPEQEQETSKAASG